MAGKTFPWGKTRRLAQALFLLGWLALWIAAARPGSIVRLPAQLDPLLALAQGIAARSLAGGMLLSLVVLGLALVFGRAWCGWLCPVGAVLDLFPLRGRKRAKMPETLRQAKYLLLAVLLIAAAFGNLTLLFLDPLTLWVRTLTWGVGPALNTAFTAAETALVSIPWLEGPVIWLDQALRPALFPATVVGVRLAWLPVILFTALVLLNLLAERFWCRYLCPLGGLLGLVSRFALVRRRVGADCKGCGLCLRACPTGTIDPGRSYASDPAECTLCMDCLSACPTRKIQFRPGLPLPEALPYDPTRRGLLAAGALTLSGLAVLKTGDTLHLAPTNLLRPPGAANDELLTKCLRCGLCLRACPTGGLQAAITEGGLAGLFTPVLVPRLGYCLYSCNACGQACPVEAIPALALEEKQQQVIGNAYIDQNRCFPWADGATCIVCEEMCPLPEKAILLEEKAVPQPDGSLKTLQLPRVLHERCIGCGICEYKCPQVGQAAIRVHRV